MRVHGLRLLDLLFVDRSTGKGISISHWDSDEELTASETSGYLQEQFGKFADVFAAPPIREIYELSVAERPKTKPSHARIVTTQLKPGFVQDAPAVYRDQLLPIIRQQPGFLGAMQLVDNVTGKIVSATAWQSEADMLAGQASGGYIERLRASGMVGQNQVAPPIVEHYEVAVRWVRDS
jgi:heme-degrading monooxygenase HmoA